MDAHEMQLTTIVYAYSPPGVTAKGQPAVAAGGASVVVSQAAVAAIRSLICDDDGRLPMSARATLARIHEREERTTELGSLLRALERRDIFVRIGDSSTSRG